MPSDTSMIDRVEEEVPATGHRGRAPRRRDGSHGNSPLDRVTVNLVRRASEALQRVSDRTGDTKTDCLNRAVQIYDYLDEITSQGGDIYIRESKDSELQLVKML